MADQKSKALLREIRACTVCAAHLASGPRPIVQFAKKAQIVIIGQAPGARVHESGIPWQDDSGNRLREWTGLSREDFYDPDYVALLPMGFCYPGTGTSGDLPPRPECAPLWHHRVLSLLSQRRLTLLVGSYAHQRYLKLPAQQTMTETVRGFRKCGPEFFPLPHPSWRSGLWMKRNPWFSRTVLPALRAAVAEG
jgi:uracil-DNA glycosylase